MLLKVECYSGYKADERPVRFSFVSLDESADAAQNPFARSQRVYGVTELVDRWYGPGYDCFKVRADDHNLYVLRHHLGKDTWSLDSFRRDAELSSR